MGIHDLSTKDIGRLGEMAASRYLLKQGFTILGKNISSKFGELDIVAARQECLHIIEVKSLRCAEFPDDHASDRYSPGENLHRNKVRKVVRMALWYVERNGWEGEWQVDGALVWLRARDGMARIRYLPQIL